MSFKKHLIYIAIVVGVVVFFHWLFPVTGVICLPYPADYLIGYTVGYLCGVLNEKK